MKTLKRKISLSFLWLIVITSIAIVILFNISIRLYSQNIAKKELVNTVSSMQVLVKQQISLNGGNNNNGKKLKETVTENLKLMRSAWHVTKMSSDTEFLIVDREGEIRFPTNFEDSFLSDEIVIKAIDNLSSKASEITSFKHGNIRYYTLYEPIIGILPNGAKLVFISNSDSLSGLIRVVNIILLCITVIATIIGVLISTKLSKSITKPISELSEYAKQIGNGVFLTLPPNKTSKEIYNLTQSMNEMSKRLTDYDRTQKTFLQNASHEIRTPLMSIQGYAEGIAKGVFSDATKTAEIICEESKRLNALVEGLLTLSRIENNSYQNDFEVVNLSDIMKEYIQKINGYALKENKKLRLNILQENIRVKINDTLLSQAVINIISNCIKYGKSEVDVEIDMKYNIAVLKISDDGEGIKEKDLPHIFDRFYKGKSGNFGLGLSIAKSAIEFMGGRIKAYNNSGAVFEITLPIYNV